MVPLVGGQWESAKYLYVVTLLAKTIIHYSWARILDGPSHSYLQLPPESLRYRILIFLYLKKYLNTVDLLCREGGREKGNRTLQGD